MTQNHREILDNDPDLVKLLSFDGNPNQLGEFDDQFISRVTEKIAQIDAVNPEGISRRAAWNLHGRLVAALAKYHKSKVDSVYDDARALTQSTAQAVSTIRVGMRKAHKTGSAKQAVEVGEKTAGTRIVRWWETPVEANPTAFDLSMDRNVAQIDKITRREEPDYPRSQFAEDDQEPFGFGDESAPEFDWAGDESMGWNANQSMDISNDDSLDVSGANEPVNVSNDTGIEVDISIRSPNLPLASDDDGMRAPSPESSVCDFNDTDNAQAQRSAPTLRRVPFFGKPIKDFKTKLTGYVMKTRISNPWIDTRPRKSDLPVLTKRKSAKELLSTPAYAYTNPKYVWNSLLKIKVRRAETDKTILDDVLGADAKYVFDDDDDDVDVDDDDDDIDIEPVAHNTRKRANNDEMFDTIRYAEGNMAHNTRKRTNNDETFDTIRYGEGSMAAAPAVAAPADVFDNIEMPSIDDADAFEGTSDGSVRVTPQKEANRHSFQPFSSVGPVSEEKLLRELELLWARNVDPIHVEDLLEPGCGRFGAAKTFGALMVMNKKSLVILEKDDSGKIANIRPGNTGRS